MSTNINSLPIEHQNPPGLLSQLAYGMANSVRRFSLGVAAAAGILTPLSKGLKYFAQLSNMIPEMTHESNIRQQVTILNNFGFKKFNITALLNATCTHEEFINQFNSHLPVDKQVTPLVFKMRNAYTLAVDTPLAEEMIFRGFIQDLLLTRYARAVVKQIALEKGSNSSFIMKAITIAMTPIGNAFNQIERLFLKPTSKQDVKEHDVKEIAAADEAWLNSSTAKAIRVGTVTILFTGIHLYNKKILPDSLMNYNLVNAFLGGVGLGILKESELGFLGSVGAHMAHNFFTIILPTLLEC